jgi:hypothetical protein
MTPTVALMSPDIISRKSARAAGRTFYFTGKPCKRGHVAERYAHNGECVVCSRLRAARWRKTTKGKAYEAEYRRTPEMRERRRKYWNEWYKRRAQQRAERAAKDSS